ncbi:unnamed protein product [Schistosoma mattheei]|uniref:Uncharacterized protein n=1 Tax=Schistosoma mattheei TaxID=31246 RepID=A0A183NXL7_9TREM|nr:unnamed protein product [Schistosoma mattheei]
MPEEVFCLDLVSHLAQHYNIQATLDRAAFMIDSLYHFLTVVVSAEERSSLLYECLSSLLRLGSAFPNLAPIIARLLLSVGLMISSTLSDDSRSYMLCQLETLRASSQQETLDPGFVLLDTRQQGVPVILKELVLHDGFDPVSPIL